VLFGAATVKELSQLTAAPDECAKMTTNKEQ